MKLAKFAACWIGLFALCILFRLPNLLSRNLFFDIDEAVIGIMAKDLLNGHSIPYYFYRQNYGFSTVETLFTAFFIKLLGAGVWALKLAGLSMFSLGGTFLLYSLKHKKVSTLCWICAFIIIAGFPSWYIWGTLMRGGYLTSFVCVTAVVYITQRFTNSYLYVTCCALLFFIAYESQILIFLPVLPLLMYWLWSQKIEFGKLLLFSLMFFIPFIARNFFISEYYGSISMTITFEQVMKSLELFSGFFVEAFTHFYTYGVLFDIPPYWHVIAIILLFLILTLITLVFIQSTSSRKTIILILLGTIGSLIVSTFGDSFSPRYVLGFFTGIMILTVYIIPNLNGVLAKIGLVLVVLAVIIGTSAGSKINRHWVICQGNEMEDLHNLYLEVKKQDVKALYSIDKTFTWDYLYGDEIPCTNICGFDRTPRFWHHLRKIESNGGKIGLFGNGGYQSEIVERFDTIPNFYGGTTYYLIPSIDSITLRKAKSVYCGSNF